MPMKAALVLVSGLSLYFSVGLADGGYDKQPAGIVPLESVVATDRTEHLPETERQYFNRQVSFQGCVSDWDEASMAFTDSPKMPLHHHLATRHASGIRSLAAAMNVVGCADRDGADQLLPVKVDTVVDDRAAQALRLPTEPSDKRS